MGKISRKPGFLCPLKPGIYITFPEKMRFNLFPIPCPLKCQPKKAKILSFFSTINRQKKSKLRKVNQEFILRRK